MKTRIVASALIRHKNTYLFIKQDKKDGAYRGTLHLPGGGIEDGESIKDGIRREVREETNLELANLVPFDFFEDFLDYKGEYTHLIYLRFTANSITQNAIPASDAKEIVWLTKEQVETSNQNYATINMLKKLGFIFNGPIE